MFGLIVMISLCSCLFSRLLSRNFVSNFYKSQFFQLHLPISFAFLAGFGRCSLNMRYYSASRAGEPNPLVALKDTATS